MIDKFIVEAGEKLRHLGFLVDFSPSIPGLRSLLYVRAHGPQRMAFARVEDHFLFLDWENDLFARLDLLLDAHKKFSSYVNRSFKVPHAWRMTMPNLVTAAVSTSEFHVDAVECAQNRYLNHWAGGETGQLMLIKLPERRLIHHPEPYRMSRQTGSIPLVHAVEVFKGIV